MTLAHQIRRRLDESFLGPVVDPVLRRYLRYRKLRRERDRFREALRPSDAFLVGHPKSGNTWLAYMLAILQRPDHADEITLANIGEWVPTIHHRDQKVAQYEDLPDPRIFRQEEPRWPALYPRVIFLTRDPRAVLLSYYHMYLVFCGFGAAEVPLAGFVREYLDKGCIEDWEPHLIRWDRHARYWIDRQRRADDVLLVKYEEMIEDRREVLRKAVRFLDIPSPDDALERAVRRGSFQSMRSDEDRHGAESYRRAKGQGRFIRKGRVDSWKEELPPDVAEAITAEFRPVMEELGYID
jgi:hypothetical protein